MNRERADNRAADMLDLARQTLRRQKQSCRTAEKSPIADATQGATVLPG